MAPPPRRVATTTTAVPAPPARQHHHHHQSPARRLLALLLSAALWLHASTVGAAADWLETAVLGSWEESVKSLIREAFFQASRALNAMAAFGVGLLDADYSRRLRDAWTRREDELAQHAAWWGEDLSLIHI